MTTHDAAWPDGTPCWVDLVVDDLAKARHFYASLFGWDIEQAGPEHGGYASCTKDGRSVAGLQPRMSPAQPDVWTTYLATSDLDATAAAVTRHGGRLLSGPMDIAEAGRMALAVDPGGAPVAFWQAGAHTGFGLTDEPGSVTWSENMSRAWTHNRAFYTAVCGWEYDDISGGDFQYAVFKVGGAMAGGIGQIGPDLPAEVPPAWTTYFKVEDTDAAAREVERLGGRVTAPAWDSEFGRMAAVTDDQGAAFTLMSDVVPTVTP